MASQQAHDLKARIAARKAEREAAAAIAAQGFKTGSSVKGAAEAATQAAQAAAVPAPKPTPKKKATKATQAAPAVASPTGKAVEGRPETDLVLWWSFDQETVELGPIPTADGTFALSVPGGAKHLYQSGGKLSGYAVKHRAYLKAGGFCSLQPNTLEGSQAALKVIKGKGVGPASLARRTPENVEAYRAWAKEVLG